MGEDRKCCEKKSREPLVLQIEIYPYTCQKYFQHMWLIDESMIHNERGKEQTSHKHKQNRIGWPQDQREQYQAGQDKEKIYKIVWPHRKRAERLYSCQKQKI